MAIYVKSGYISVKNGPIFNPKPPLESSELLLGQVR